MQRPGSHILSSADWFAERLLPLALGILAGTMLGNFVVFSKRMRKDEAPGQDTHRDSGPMTELALACHTPQDKTQHSHRDCDPNPHFILPPFVLGPSYHK